MKSCLKTWSFSPLRERHPAAKIFRASPPLYSKNGFTLIEVIVTIIAAGIMGAFFMNYMGTAMSQSTRAIEYVEGETSAEEIANQIITEYIYELNRDPNTALTTIAARDHGSRVSKQFINFVVSGTQGNLQGLTTGSSNTLRVAIKLTRDINPSVGELNFLLTKSRLTASPKVNF